FEQRRATRRRPPDVHQQVVVAVALNPSDASTHAPVSTRRRFQLRPTLRFLADVSPALPGFPVGRPRKAWRRRARDDAAAALPRPSGRGSWAARPNSKTDPRGKRRRLRQGPQWTVNGELDEKIPGNFYRIKEPHPVRPGKAGQEGVKRAIASRNPV